MKPRKLNGERYYLDYSLHPGASHRTVKGSAAKWVVMICAGALYASGGVNAATYAKELVQTNLIDPLSNALGQSINLDGALNPSDDQSYSSPSP